MEPTPNASELWARFETTANAPDKAAVITSQGVLTFGSMHSAAERLSSRLSEIGIRAGDAVHLVLPNDAVFFPAFLALNKLAALAGLVPARYRDSEFQALTELARPRAYLTTPALASVLERSIAVTSNVPIVIEQDAVDLRLVFPGDGVGGHTGAASTSWPSANLRLVKFTSGSTGSPKGVGLTEANLLAETSNIIETLSIGESDRILVPVPVSHSYGFDLGVLPVLLAGASAVLKGAFVPRELLSDLANKDVTILLGVPSMYRVLAEMEMSDDAPDLSHVRYLLSSTAPLLPSLIREFHDRFQVPICQHYGSSETGAIANHVPSAVLDRPSSVGIAMRGVDIRIVGEHGQVLRSGEEGEIVVRSRAVASGYVGHGVPAQAAFAPVDDSVSEYRTGDLGVLDEEGYLSWRGRRDQVINVGGLKVYPSEVAQVLESCPAVASAHVVGARDQSGEEFVHAVVTLSESIREQDLLAWCRKRLADYKVPRSIEIADSIPSGGSKKVRNLLGDIYS